VCVCERERERECVCVCEGDGFTSIWDNLKGIGMFCCLFVVDFVMLLWILIMPSLTFRGELLMPLDSTRLLLLPSPPSFPSWAWPCALRSCAFLISGTVNTKLGVYYHCTLGSVLLVLLDTIQLFLHASERKLDDTVWPLIASFQALIIGLTYYIVARSYVGVILLNLAYRC